MLLCVLDIRPILLLVVLLLYLKENLPFYLLLSPSQILMLLIGAIWKIVL